MPRLHILIDFFNMQLLLLLLSFKISSNYKYNQSGNLMECSQLCEWLEDLSIFWVDLGRLFRNIL